MAVTEKYGRDHAALVASFSTYHSRGAIRDLGKALGLPFGELERLARLTDGNAEARPDELAALPDADASSPRPAGARSASSAPRSAGCRATSRSTRAGWSISSRPLIELVPVQPAAMAGRQSASGTRTRATTPVS